MAHTHLRPIKKGEFVKGGRVGEETEERKKDTVLSLEIWSFLREKAQRTQYNNSIAMASLIRKKKTATVINKEAR